MRTEIVEEAAKLLKELQKKDPLSPAIIVVRKLMKDRGKAMTEVEERRMVRLAYFG